MEVVNDGIANTDGYVVGQHGAVDVQQDVRNISLAATVPPMGVLLASMCLEAKAAGVSYKEIQGLAQLRNESVLAYVKRGTDVMSVATLVEASIGVFGGGIGCLGLAGSYCYFKSQFVPYCGGWMHECRESQHPAEAGHSH